MTAEWRDRRRAADGAGGVLAQLPLELDAGLQRRVGGDLCLDLARLVARQLAVAVQVMSGMTTHLKCRKMSANTSAITDKMAVPKVTR